MIPNTSSYLGKRVMATFIDYTLIFIVSCFYIYVVGKPNDEGGYSVTGFLALGPIALWFLYFIVAEYFMGATLGHTITKLKVVSINNEPLSFVQVLARRLVDAIEISWCFGLIAFLITKNTPNNQRLGDILARTIVTGKDENFDGVLFDFEKDAQQIPNT